MLTGEVNDPEEVSMFCRNCGKEWPGEPEFCMNCGARPLSGTAYCPACAAPTTPLSEICVKCGARLPRQNYAYAPRSGKSKVASVLLAVFLGFWTWLYTYKKDGWKFWVGLLWRYPSAVSYSFFRRSCPIDPMNQIL
jgi:predicted amidophosphoribosyltransferase